MPGAESRRRAAPLSGRTPPLPYRSAGSFARERFGGDVCRAVIDAGCACPVRDGSLGSAGCLFCSIDGFRPPTSRPELPVSEQIARALPRLRRRYPRAIGFLAYLQPYTNTYCEPAHLAEVCREALAAPGCLGLVIGTRPDALPPGILDLLGELARQTFLQVELGVQSTDDAALAAMERGHDWACARGAIAALRDRGIRVGAHMILSAPWESREHQLDGAGRVSAAGVDAVKLHHLQVLRGSRLARGWEERAGQLPGWRAHAALAADFLERLDGRIVVERLCATSPRELLLAPRWEVDGAAVRREIARLLIERGSCQGSRAPET